MTDREPCRWIVDGKTYYFRQQALYAAKNDMSKITFFQEGIEEFDAMDWLIEPTQSWAKMLGIRALQLRNKYQSLRVWYSGGSDSHTMLRAFVDNGIWPNEIAMYRTSLDNNMDNMSNQEVNLGALAYVKQLEKIKPSWVNIVFYDVTPERYYNFLKQSINNLQERDWVHVELRPSNSKIRPILPEAFTDSDRTKHADVVGHDKSVPARWENGVFTDPGSKPGWYVVVSDNCWSSYEMDDPSHTKTEPFYITPDYPELEIKQVHLVKRYLIRRYGKDVTHSSLYAHHLDLRHGTYRDGNLTAQNQKDYNDLDGVTRNTYSQQFTLGKSFVLDTQERSWDRVIRAETDPNNKIIQLFGNVIQEHSTGFFKYQQNRSSTIHCRSYYIGD